MSDPPKTTPARTVEAPMTSFVRGGSVTGAYEQQQKEKRALAEKRRAAEAERQRIAATDRTANLSTTKLGGSQSHASIVLEIRNSDGKAEEFIVCELTVDRDAPDGLMLIVCCPFCAAKNGSDEAQMTIRSKHRKFELDTRRQGELWVNPNRPTEFVHLAGTVHLTDVTTCPTCARRFVIDNSVLRWL